MAVGIVGTLEKTRHPFWKKRPPHLTFVYFLYNGGKIQNDYEHSKKDYEHSKNDYERRRNDYERRKNDYEHGENYSDKFITLSSDTIGQDTPPQKHK